MYSINEKMLADDRAITALYRNTDSIDSNLKAGMLAYTFDDKNLWCISSKGVYNRLLQIDSATNTIKGDLCFENVTITQSLTVLGEYTAIDTKNLSITDNIIELNKGDTGDGISLKSSGICINRGTKPSALFTFDENIKESISGFSFKLNDERLFNILENKSINAYNDIYINNNKVLTEADTGILDKDKFYIITAGSEADIPQKAKPYTYYLSLDMQKLYYNTNEETVDANWKVTLQANELYKEEFITRIDQTAFELTHYNHKLIIDRINVYLEGQLLPQDAYTYSDGIVSLKEAPGLGYSIIIQYFN